VKPLIVDEEAEEELIVKSTRMGHHPMVSTLSTDELKAELRKLDVVVRADLVRFLLDSLRYEGELPVDMEWEAELDRRVDEPRSGKVKGIPAKKAAAEFRQQYS